jgi:hypothetical protein
LAFADIATPLKLDLNQFHHSSALLGLLRPVNKMLVSGLLALGEAAEVLAQLVELVREYPKRG